MPISSVFVEYLRTCSHFDESFAIRAMVVPSESFITDVSSNMEIGKEEKGFSKYLRDRGSEPLAKAKESLKGRLRQQMVQEVIDELRDTDQLVEQLTGEITKEDIAFDEVKVELRKRILSGLVSDIETEISDAGSVAAQVYNELGGDQSSLVDARNAVKDRLLNESAHQIRVALQESEDTVDDLSARLQEEPPSFEAEKEIVRGRVLQGLVDEVTSELQDKEQAVQTALSLFGEQVSFDGLKEAIKEQIIKQIYNQAVEEISDEFEIDEEFIASLYAESPAEKEEYHAFESEQEEPELEAFQASDEMDMAPFFQEPAQEEEIHDSFLEDIQGDDTIVLHPGTAFEDHQDDEEKPFGFFLSTEEDEEKVDKTSLTHEEVATAINLTLEDPELIQGDGAWLPTESIGSAAAQEVDHSADYYYLYGIIPATENQSELSLPDAGMDASHPIQALPFDGYYAVVSRVSSDEYGSQARGNNILDQTWVDEHTMRHENIISDLRKIKGFVSFSFATVFEDEEQVAAHLTENGCAQLLTYLGDSQEWKLELYRNLETLHSHVVENSERVQDLQNEIRSNPKGGARTIKKQMVETIHEEVNRFSEECAAIASAALMSVSQDMVLLSGDELQAGEKLVLEAVFQVKQEATASFAETLEELQAQFGEQGYDFDVSGPFYPHSFIEKHLSAS